MLYSWSLNIEVIYWGVIIGVVFEEVCCRRVLEIIFLFYVLKFGLYFCNKIGVINYYYFENEMNLYFDFCSFVF